MDAVSFMRPGTADWRLVDAVAKDGDIAKRDEEEKRRRQEFERLKIEGPLAKRYAKKSH